MRGNRSGWRRVRRSIGVAALIVLGASCSAGSQWVTDSELTVLTSGSRADSLEPDAAWKGRLIEVEDCIGVELDDSSVVSAIFFEGSQGVSENGGEQRGIRIDNGDVLVVGENATGGGAYLEDDGWAQDVPGSEHCVKTLGAQSGLLIVSGEVTR